MIEFYIKDKLSFAQSGKDIEIGKTVTFENEHYQVYNIIFLKNGNIKCDIVSFSDKVGNDRVKLTYWHNNKIKKKTIFSAMTLGLDSIIEIEDENYKISNLIKNTIFDYYVILEKMYDYNKIETFVNSLSSHEKFKLLEILNNYENVEKIDLKTMIEDMYVEYQYGHTDKQKFHEFNNRDFVFLYKDYCDEIEENSKISDFSKFLGRLYMSCKNNHTFYDVVLFDKSIIALDRIDMLKIPKLYELKFGLEDIIKNE
jgi:hypothetical protein